MFGFLIPRAIASATAERFRAGREAVTEPFTDRDINEGTLNGRLESHP